MCYDIPWWEVNLEGEECVSIGSSAVPEHTSEVADNGRDRASEDQGTWKTSTAHSICDLKTALKIVY